MRNFSVNFEDEQYDFLQKIPNRGASRLLRHLLDSYLNENTLPQLNLLFKALDSGKLSQWDAWDFINKLETKLYSLPNGVPRSG